MTQFKDLAARRRSIRKFTGEPLSRACLDALMSAVLMAPTSKGSCCWQFVVVTHPDTLRALASCKAHGSALLEGAAAAVVVLADPSVSDVWIEDASVASTYLLLQAEDAGLGACWVQVRCREAADGTPSDRVVRRLLALPEHLEVLSVIALGHKAAVRAPFDPSRLKWDRVHYAGDPSTGEEDPA